VRENIEMLVCLLTQHELFVRLSERHGVWSVTKKPLFSLREAAMQLRSQRPLHVQGDAGHPGQRGGGPKKNNWKKMKGRGVGEAQWVADPKKD
jgi:hypothetical protein